MADQNSTELEIVSETNPFVTNNSFANDSTHLAADIFPIDMQFNSGHVVSISMYALLCILSGGGNIIVLTAILRKKRHRQFLSRIDLLLLNLAIADLMVTFLMMPLEIIWAATVEWKGGDFMCRFMAFFRIFGLYLSGFLLVGLATDRYWAVCYPLRGRASTKRAKWMVLFAWFLSCLCSFPQVIIFHVETHPFYTSFTQCVTFNAFPEPNYELLYNIFVMVMMYALPFVILVVLYGSIAVKLRENGIASRGVFGAPGGLRRSGVDYIERAKVKSIRMAFVITAAFLICWTPYYVMCIWYWVDPQTARNVDIRIQRGLFIFACANSTINPLVYGVFNTRSIFGKTPVRSSREMSMRSTNRRPSNSARLLPENARPCSQVKSKPGVETAV